MGQRRQRGKIWWLLYYRNGRRYEESAHTDKWEKARDLLRDRERSVSCYRDNRGDKIPIRAGQAVQESVEY